MDRYFVNIEPDDPTGIVLTVEGLPRLLIFAENRAEALGRAREAIAFQLSREVGAIDRRPIELVPRDAVDALRAGSKYRTIATEPAYSP